MTDKRLTDLCENLWEGLNGEVTSVERLSDSQVSIKFRCDDWHNADNERNFDIRCISVTTSNVVALQCDEIELSQDHVLLWKHNSQHCNLFYSSAPENGYEVLGILWEAHERALGDFSEHYNSISAIDFVSNCESGYGLLARGPEQLIKSYHNALADKIRLNFTESYKPDGGYSILFFDNYYIIAKAFEIIEIGA